MEERVSSPYPTTPIAYFKRYGKNIKLHNESQDKSFLIYAALELRFAIEALLFYYLHALNKADLSKSQQKLYRPNDLKKAILKADPLFLVKLEFADLYASINDMVSSKLRPDIDLLNSVHGRLGAWLHAEYSPLRRKIPEGSWIELSGLFDSVNSHLSLIFSYPLLELNLTDEGDELMRAFSKGKITRETLLQRFEREWGRLFKGTTHHIIIE